MTSGEEGGKYLHVPREDKLAIRTRDTEMVSRAGWNRLRIRILDDLGDASSNWLSAGFAFLGIGASAVLALVALPTVTTPGAELAPSVEPWLYTTAIFCAVLCLVFFGVHWSTRRARKGVAQDIVGEMDTMVPPESLPGEASKTDTDEAPPLPASQTQTQEWDRLPDLYDIDQLDDATLALEVYGPALRELQEDLRGARDMFSRAESLQAYWSPTEGNPPTKAWKRHKDVLRNEPTFADLVSKATAAFRDIERVGRIRPLRWGGKVKPSDALPQAIERIDAADAAITERFEQGSAHR